jgi:hypothetical protein
MKNCAICNKEFPNRILIDGKYRNTQRRRYCLECSPFGKHNTIKLEEENSGDCLECGNKLKGKQTMYCSKKCKCCSPENFQRTYKSQKKRRLNGKKELVLMKGGCCEKCGYDKNLRALEFHHKDPSLKSFGISYTSIASKSWTKILKEVEKCELLCANCHREHHSPNLNDWKK